MEIIDELIETIGEEIGDAEAAKRIVRRITRDFGGSQVYIPQERFAFREDFEAEVYAAFNGSNYRELSRRFGISKTTAHSIIKDVRKRRRKRDRDAQGDLFR